MIDLNVYSHLSFDLDGTLLDSSEVMSLAWESTREKFNLDPTFDAYRLSTGIPFSNIMENLGIEDEGFYIQNYYFSQTAKNVDRLKLFPGVSEFLDYWSNVANKSWSIITSKPRSNTLQILKHLDISPNVLVCGDDLIGKPHPKSMVFVKNKLNLDQAESILYIGDTVTDYIFAITSNVDYLHADFGLHGKFSDCIYPKCDSIKSFKEIINL